VSYRLFFWVAPCEAWFADDDGREAAQARAFLSAPRLGGVRAARRRLRLERLRDGGKEANLPREKTDAIWRVNLANGTK
jgi:hypothetical protein